MIPDDSVRRISIQLPRLLAAQSEGINDCDRQDAAKIALLCLMEVADDSEEGRASFFSELEGGGETPEEKTILGFLCGVIAGACHARAMKYGLSLPTSPN